jgi:hypothetical protein
MQSRPAPESTPKESTEPILVALTDVLRSEARLLRELISVMRSQKVALAATDTQAVEDSVYAIHRVLHTLSAARERRRSINRILADIDDLPIGDLEGVIGAGTTPDLRIACEDLAASAGELGETLDDTWLALRTAVTTQSSLLDSPG